MSDVRPDNTWRNTKGFLQLGNVPIFRDTIDKIRRLWDQSEGFRVSHLHSFIFKLTTHWQLEVKLWITKGLKGPRSTTAKVSLKKFDKIFSWIVPILDSIYHYPRTHVIMSSMLWLSYRIKSVDDVVDIYAITVTIASYCCVLVCWDSANGFVRLCERCYRSLDLTICTSTSLTMSSTT